MYNTPILFIIFNRPEVTRLVFNEIKKIKPVRLFIAADGPRKNKESDPTLCQETRKIIEQINWPCEVKTLFRDENFGCGKAVSSAITWFFDHVEQGIILEDDCLPDPSFFPYCSELLEYYKNEEKVMHIGGVNFQNDNKRGDGSFYFSAISHVWGWATWKRAWNKYDFNLNGYENFNKSGIVSEYFNDKKIIKRWMGTFRDMRQHKIDTWDHQWTFTVLSNHGLAIVPNVNLISNIGFGIDATHTHSADSVHSNAITKPILLPTKKPSFVSLDKEADYFFLKEIEHWETQRQFSLYWIKNTLRTVVIQIAEYWLRHFYFKSKVKRPRKSILIQKTDAIGDYIIVRNLIKSFIESGTFEEYKIFLLANVRLKTFIEQCDKGWFEEVIYFDPSVLNHFRSKYRFYFKLRNYRFQKLIHPTYSRSVITDDIIYFSGVSEVIGYKGDCSNITADNKKITDLYFSQLIDVDEINKSEFTHEFIKQKAFFNTLSKQPININKPFLSDVIKPTFNNCICVCPGASESYKMWNTLSFAGLITRLAENYLTKTFIILCGPGEQNIGEEIYFQIADVVKAKVRVVSVNSVLNLIKEIAQSQLIISNDSAPFHVAHALEIPAVCVFNGSKIGRFVPYFGSDEKYKIVIPDSLMSELNSNPNKYKYYYRNISKHNVNSITVDSVYSHCTLILSEK